MVALALGAMGLLGAEPSARATSPQEARQLVLSGQYAAAAQAAKEGAAAGPDQQDWPLIGLDALLAGGRLAEAKALLLEALPRFPMSIRLRLKGCDVLRQNGDPAAAQALFNEIEQLAASRPWAYGLPVEQLALGRASLLAGADPKAVLERFFDPVQRAAPELPEAWQASGELALAKNDFALAANIFEKAAKAFPTNPEMHFGLARAYAPSDPEPMGAALERTLALNPNHVGARLLLAEHAIDGEKDEAATKLLREALQSNPACAEAHALLAVLAHLHADPKEEKQARDAALRAWPTNPAVDFLIGRKLSQKYRFAEGAARQRQALEFDPAYLPAKMQLAQDLLRLGQDEEGWRLVEEVQKADPYDVVAFNLATLRDRLAKFQTLTSEHFTVRMEPREAAVYGKDVLALLERAHGTLTKKYGLDLQARTIVELFPEQKDFAIRTFGLPGGSGYLGVCFGRLITANSPAARPDAVNWQSVLWHEFCHVVTLTLTKNKMPRWLSEGISVYEERQARGFGGNTAGAWGERMKPRYRAMILGGELTPVSQLSGAFLNPKTPAHIGFAYYESSLVVEYLLERFGQEKMRRILADLARGVEINTAIATHALPIAQVDQEFAKRARALAEATGPALSWAKPAPEDLGSEEATARFAAKNPDNFTVLSEQALRLVRNRQWAEAKVPLKKLIELYPEQRDPDGPYAMLAQACRELGETDAERAALERLAELSPGATGAFARLIELARARKDWAAVDLNATRFAAVNPLSALPHEAAAEAAEAQGKAAAAAGSYRTALTLDPANPAALHFRLARLLRQGGDPGAKREVLLALEEAPRFQAALELLREMDSQPAPKPSKDKPR